MRYKMLIILHIALLHKFVKCCSRLHMFSTVNKSHKKTKTNYNKSDRSSNFVQWSSIFAPKLFTNMFMNHTELTAVFLDYHEHTH